jgi:hypothetical protein
MNSSDTPAALYSFSPRLVLFLLCAVLLWLPCSYTLAQTANLNYTADLPSVERVKAEIKGSDPTDTLARQCAVFTYLPAYIERIKYNRTVRGPYTPDEQRLIVAYQLAAYQISQDYAKTHSPDEAKAFERLHGQYEMNSDFYKDWSHRLIGPQSAAAYKNMESEMGARQQAHVAAEKRTYEEANAKTTNAQGLSNDPTAVATRRCLELGGSSIACMGKGLGAGFLDMIGLHPGELMGSGRAGVVLSGRYRNPATTASLDFGPDTVSIVDCGKLVADGHSYTIEKRPGLLRVHVDNEPQPFVLTMRSDGGLVGPGPIDVKGRIIIGYHTVTHTLYVNGAPAVGAQYGCNGVCQTSESVPDYAPKIERCTIGSLAMPPRPKPEAQPAAGESAGMFGVLTGLFDTGEMKIPLEPGLRVTGQFISGKLVLDFTPTSIILDCGEAHVRGVYTVENATDQLLVHVDNPGGPFTLAVESDNSLRGTGSTTVNGRLVSGMQGENVTFTPRVETCEVASFRPKTGSSATGSTTKVAGNNPPLSAPSSTAPPATPAAPASVAYASTSPTPALSTAVPHAATSSTGTRAAMRVLITSNFAANTNPMAGQTIYIMRERMDDVLRKLGAPIPPNTTPAQAWQAFATACLGKGVDCTPVWTALKSHFVTATKLDATGKATLSATATTGAYFLFAQVRSPEGLMVWDLPQTFVAGDNTVTLTAANAEHLQ